MNERRSLLERVESLLRVDLVDSLGMGSKAEAESLVTQFLSAVAELPPTALERQLVPHWVVLAAGLGTRIDPTGHMNKNLDVWFGGYNTLQLARRYLPGNREHIVVLHPDLAARLRCPGNDEIDPEKANRYLGPEARIVIQPVPDGTGGALRAAASLLRHSDAEFIGVAFGDEPFLDQPLFMQTLVSHFIHGADVTLCGKVPETVVDKGGLFFDEAGRFEGTREWAEMTPEQQQRMWARLEQGSAYTNTGITLIRRTAALERLDRLQPHGRKQEYHHVDLIRHCYQEDLKTHAYIYRGEITSGVNRWNNVLVGQERLERQINERLTHQGIRVLPGSRIALGEGQYALHPEIRLERGSQFSGEIFIGHGCSVGSYSRLHNATISGRSHVGNSVEVKDSRVTGSHIEDNPPPDHPGAPTQGLRTISRIESCDLDRVWVGGDVHLDRVQAHRAWIPQGTRVSNQRLGLARPSLPWPSWLPSDYRPGTRARQGDKALQQLRHQLLESWTPAATRDPSERQRCEEAISDYLHWPGPEGQWALEGLTYEQIAGVLCEIVRLITGNESPGWHERRERMLEVETGQIPGFERSFSGSNRSILWLAGTYRSLPAEIHTIQRLTAEGHRVTVAAKSVSVIDDATLGEVRFLRERLGMDTCRLIDTGSTIQGIDLLQTDRSFRNALTNADLIVACGAHRNTVQGLDRERVSPPTSG